MKICDFYVYIPMDVDGIDISASESIILSLRLASWKANEAYDGLTKVLKLKSAWVLLFLALMSSASFAPIEV